MVFFMVSYVFLWCRMNVVYFPMVFVPETMRRHMKQLEKTIGEFSKSILKQEKAAKKAEDDCLAVSFPRGPMLNLVAL